VAQKKLFKPITTWLVSQSSLHSGQWDGKLHPMTIRILLPMRKLSLIINLMESHSRVYSSISHILQKVLIFQ
jgi:hypothetical protein